jgi:hypothetical protein
MKRLSRPPSELRHASSWSPRGGTTHRGLGDRRASGGASSLRCAMLTTRRKVLLFGLPIALVLATTVILVHLATGYKHDAATKWTAIAAVLAGAALAAAVVGLPVGLFQLFAVERDLARLRLVSEGHLQELGQLLINARDAINRDMRLQLGDPPAGRQLYRDAFNAHFPDLAKPFFEWDRAVECVEAALAAFAQAVERTADETGIIPDRYDRAAIVQQLRQRMPPGLHLALEEWPDRVPVEAWANGKVAFAGVVVDLKLPTDAYGGTTALSEDELNRQIQPLIDLCERVRQLPEVEMLAEVQDELTAMRDPLRDEVRLYQVTETFPISEACPICRRNLGESDIAPRRSLGTRVGVIRKRARRR